MLHTLRQQGIAPAGLLTSINESADRVAMHAVRHSVLRAQAAAAGLPLMIVPLPHPCANDVYEQRMTVAVSDALTQGFTHVAFGDLFLEDVRRYREERMAGTGLTPIFPLWGRPTPELGREMIRGGLEARITCVDPRVLPAEFAGRAYDEALLRDLPDGVDPCGERGEFHTCVTGGPMFGARIDATIGEVVERDGFVFCDLLLSTPNTQLPTPEGTGVD
jgi:diphthamide synthase (EF-2-diphthine--ammonia ligase)